MFYILISLLGLILGYFIAHKTKEEFQDGIKYFKILELVILTALIIILIINNFNIYLIIPGLVLGFFLRFEYFYLGIAALNNNFLIQALIFSYGLPKGTIIYKDRKAIIFSLVLFIVGLTFYFFNYNLNSFAAGALLTIMALKTKSIFF
jgi:hypothetical protein